MKTVALIGGGDWYDASVEFLEVPESVDFDKARAAWREWYQTYVPKRDKFITFSTFLQQRYGATLATHIKEEWEP